MLNNTINISSSPKTRKMNQRKPVSSIGKFLGFVLTIGHFQPDWETYKQRTESDASEKIKYFISF